MIEESVFHDIFKGDFSADGPASPFFVTKRAWNARKQLSYPSRFFMSHEIVSEYMLLTIVQSRRSRIEKVTINESIRFKLITWFSTRCGDISDG